MEKNNTCPACGKALPADAPKGLCPACLIKAALPSASISATQAVGGPQIEAPETRTINPAAGMRVRYFGDYELLEEIARGGMGVVWKARQTSLNRIVALKMILSGEFASEREMERFRREAEAAANLQHPNIVAIHEIGQRDGQHYFSMDYVDGQNLNALVRDNPLPPQRAAQYLKTIAEAIHFAHQRGTLHRDLKPQNVLIDSNDQPRITDFGLAKVVGQASGLTESGAIMGSPSYMPPEQASGRLDRIGPHSDVYSLGAILYELLTGRPPFQAATAMATLRQVVDDEPAPPRKLNPNVPADLETICLKCLEKLPQQRYANARDLAEDLGRFLNHDPILARPASASRKVEQWVKRHPMVLSGVAALALLVVSALAYGLWQQNQYLVWHAAHPEIIISAGQRIVIVHTPSGDIASVDPRISACPRTEQLHRIRYLALCMVLFFIVFLNPEKRGVPVSKMFDKSWLATHPRPPMSLRDTRFYELAGIFCVAFALYYLTKVLDARIWEAYSIPVVDIIMVYILVSHSCRLVLFARRERRVQLFGRDPGALDASRVAPELRARVATLLREGMPSDAFELYRESTGCDSADAKTAVQNIAKQNGMPELPLAKLSASKLLRNLAITAIVVAGILYFVSPAWRLPLLDPFSCGWVIMVAVTTGRHYRGFFKRWFFPILLLLGLSQGIDFLFRFIPDQGLELDPFPRFLVFLVGWFAGTRLVEMAHKTARK